MYLNGGSKARRVIMGEPQRKAIQESENLLTPAGLIAAARKAHPAFRYAIAAAGIGAIVVIFAGFHVEPAKLVLGAIMVIAIMVFFGSSR
jgi:hypothetical protein